MSTLVLRSQPGIKRDGTRYDGDFYTDGQWVRFQRGLPRKMGGYRSITKFLNEISRGMAAYTSMGMVYAHSGSATELKRFTINSSLSSSIMIDRTPATLKGSTANMWMFDYMYDPTSVANSIIAHVAPNGSCVCNNTDGQLFYGDVLGAGALTEIMAPANANFTGGVVILHPYLFYYGSDGVIGWSIPGGPTDLTGVGSGIARVWGQKIIKGLPLRAGSGSAPAGIFWAYDAVIRASFVGGAPVFNFDVLASDTSIMSAASVVDFDGVFYWVGVDRFLMFNGVVREVPNTMNLNWFFDNLNPEQRTKVFAFKITRFGEIWWCYPRGSATECTHAIVYNVRENSWYDTALPNSGRSAAVFSNAFVGPLLAGVNATADGYKVWIHERGTDSISGQELLPVESYFETSDISSLMQGNNGSLRITTIEPDFIQSGDMSVQITGRANARAPEVYSTEFKFPEKASSPHEQIVVLKEQRRELRVKFRSNTIGGDYQMGQIIGHIEPGDKRVLG